MSQSAEFANVYNVLERHKSVATLGDAAQNFEITKKNPIWNPLPDFNRKLYTNVAYSNSFSPG